MADVIIPVTSLDVAILTKVTELAKRFDLKARDAIAELRYDDETHQHTLRFPSCPIGKGEEFDRMMELIGSQEGVVEDEQREGVFHTESQLELDEALDAALSKAPRSRRL